MILIQDASVFIWTGDTKPTERLFGVLDITIQTREQHWRQLQMINGNYKAIPSRHFDQNEKPRLQISINANFETRTALMAIIKSGRDQKLDIELLDHDTGDLLVTLECRKAQITTRSSVPETRGGVTQIIATTTNYLWRAA